MEFTTKTMFFKAVIMIATAQISTCIAESRNFNTAYGFGAPINVGGESLYGLGNSYSGSSSSSSNGYGTRNYGHSGYTGFGNGLSFGGANGLSYGIGSSGFPGSNNYNHYSQNTLPQNNHFLTSNGYGNNFYPGNAYIDTSFGAYGLNRHFGVGSGPGNYGLHSPNNYGNVFTNGYALGTGYTGIGGNFGGNPNYGNHYSIGMGYGISQPFK